MEFKLRKCLTLNISRRIDCYFNDGFDAMMKINGKVEKNVTKCVKYVKQGMTNNTKLL